MKKVLYTIIIVVFSISIYGCEKNNLQNNAVKESIQKFMDNYLDYVISNVEENVEGKIKIEEKSENEFEIHICLETENTYSVFSSRDTYPSKWKKSIKNQKEIVKIIEDSLKNYLKDDYKDIKIKIFLDAVDPTLENIAIYSVDGDGNIYQGNKIIEKYDEIEIKNEIKKDIQKYVDEYMNDLTLQVGIAGEGKVEEISENEFEIHIYLKVKDTISVYAARDMYPLKWEEHINSMESMAKTIKNTLENHFEKKYENIVMKVFMDAVDPTISSLTIYSVDSDGNLHEDEEIKDILDK